MKTLTATYRIVTPMFLGGANPESQAELRVSSIKGALRFWWRALMWGEVENIKELHQKEAELFGSTDKGQSKVSLYISGADSISLLNPPNILNESGNLQIPRPNFDPRSGKRPPEVAGAVEEGARYLGYGLIAAFASVKKDKNKQLTGEWECGGQLYRTCVAAPLEFQLHLQFRGSIQKHLEQQLIKALKLLGLCGGLGSRSRRGFGSLSLTALQHNGSTIWTAPKGAEEWEQELRSMLSSMPEKAGLPEWTSFAKGKSKILLLSSSPTSPLALLARMGRDFVFYRSWGRNGKVFKLDSEKLFKDDHDLMKMQPHRRTTHPRRVVFGLPHNYGKGRENQVEPADKNLDRRASPLFFHIHQPTFESPPLGVVIFLPSLFLPPKKDNISVGGKIVPLAHNGTGEFWQPVHAFLERLQKGNGKEKFHHARLVEL